MVIGSQSSLDHLEELPNGFEREQSAEIFENNQDDLDDEPQLDDEDDIDEKEVVQTSTLPVNNPSSLIRQV